MFHMAIPQDEQGPSLNDYEKGKEIGHGTFGQVCKFSLKNANQLPGFPKEMAVKMVKVGRGTKIEREADIRVLMGVSHDHVVKLYGISATDTHLYFKMELANSDLSRVRKERRGRKFRPADVRRLALQILDGLGYLHNANICHRDLKPQNILVFWKNESIGSRIISPSSITLKVSDFGLSKIGPETLATTFMLRKIDFCYMAPEVASSHSNNAVFHGNYKKADVFSAGIIIYEMLYGQKPFSVEDLKREEAATPPEYYIGGEGSFVMRYVKKMLDWAPMGRCNVEYVKENWKENGNICKRVSAYIEKGIRLGKWTLELAVEKQDLEAIEWLIRSGQDVNGNRNDFLTTPALHTACEKGYLEVAKLLIERGADVNKFGECYSTPLNIASENGYLEVVELLIRNGVDVNIRDSDARTPLLSASFNGHLAVVKFLVDNGANFINGFGEEDPWTPLHEACRGGHLAVAEFLISRGADVGSCFSDPQNRKTAFHVVCQNGHLAVAQMLIERGADADMADEDGLTPLHYASKHGHLAVAQLLLDKGTRINTADNDGRNALHWACGDWKGNIHVVKLLIEKGADVLKEDVEGKTPLHHACERNHLSAAQFLVGIGSEVNKSDANGCTPLHYASNNYSPFIAQFLIRKGADTNREDGIGRTPLHYACTNWYKPSVAQMLVKEGADVNQADNAGMTPLLTCIASDHDTNNILALFLQDEPDASHWIYE